MDEKTKKKLAPLIRELSANSKAVAIFAFGSQVNGKPREDSDIDIAVLTAGKLSRSEELDIISSGDDSFDISLFDKLPLIIQFRIIKEGLLLLCKDEKSLHRIRVRTITGYLDYSLFINRFYKRVIQNV